MAPRLTSGRKGRSTLTLASSNPTGAPPREAAPGDNSMARDEADRVQLISIVSKLSQADDAIEVAKAPLKAAQAHRKTIIGLGKTAGFSAKELERRLEEMKAGTRENAIQVKRERDQRRWLGIIDADQEELLLGEAAPSMAKDEAHWAGEGYKAGLRQMKADPPSGCTGPMLQAYMKAHERGLNEVTAANAPRPTPPTVREQAARDFEEDNKPEPGTPEAKRLEREAVRKAKESLEKMGMGEPANEGDAKGPDDGFEASPEELAAQSGRRQADEEVV